MPSSARKKKKVSLLLRRCAEQLERVHGAVREHGTELESEIGGGPELGDGGVEDARRALAPEFRKCAERGPAGRDELLVGLAEARSGDHAILGPAGAVHIPGSIQRLEDVLGKARRFLE